MKRHTWIAYYTDGATQYFYCAKDEILDFMSVRSFMELDRVEMVNRPDDNVKHRPLTKEDLLKSINRGEIPG